MADTTEIAWTDSTFNPWIGCTKIGPGCDHCYAERDFDHRFGQVKWGPGNPRRRTAVANWRKPLQWERSHDKFFAEHGHRRRVFCASLADVFDNEVPPEWRADLFELIEATPHLDWLILTKRIGNVSRMIPERWGNRLPVNIWLGITVVDQNEADRDIPKLLQIDAGIRFLSMEPLLGAVNIVPFIGGRSIKCACGYHETEFDVIGGARHEWCLKCGEKTVSGPTIDWVIVGGESGPNSRPMAPVWAVSLYDQCSETGTSFLFKQWGGTGDKGGCLLDGVEVKQWPSNE